MGQLTTIVDASEEILAAQAEFELVSKDVLSFRREYQFAMQYLEKNDYLLQIALKNPQSLKNAIINVGAIGLSLNTAERLAYLVPMDGAVQLQIGYIGFLKLAVMDGGISWGHAELVKEKDTFTFNGVGREPTHQFKPFEDRGKIIGTYFVAKTHDGSFLTRMMSYDECIKIRNRSKIWIKKPNSGPWATDEGEMVKKTVVKQGAKTLPKGATSRLEKAIEVVNEYEGIDFEKPPVQGKTSNASDLLNKKLGAPIDPEVKKIIESIISTCKIICENYTDIEKKEFVIRELQVATFNELYLKDVEYLSELEVHINRLLPNEDVIVDVPAWDD